MNNYFLNQNIQNAFYTLHEYWIKNYPNATLIIEKQTTITDNSRTHTVIRPKKTTTKRKKIGSKMDKYLLESITAAIFSPSNTIGKTLQEILFIDKNLSYGRQLKLYSYLMDTSADSSGIGLAGLGIQSSHKKKAHVNSVYSHGLLFKKPKILVADDVVDLSAGPLSLEDISSAGIKPVVS
ncbi:hypothetical protein G9A89_014000 [Geosiphon pyriformis]|nr:hypothetical protein G9A89_014000 [Geosiphon pyriformis]